MAKPSPIRMTDHALLRWLERAGLIDVEMLRMNIETALDRAFVAGISTGADNFLIVAHDLVYVVRQDRVTTVINDDGQAHHRARLLDSPLDRADRT